MFMSRSQRCVTSSSSRSSLHAFPQQSKETAISHHTIMSFPYEPDSLDVFRRLLLSENELSFDLAHITESFPFLLEQHFPGKVRLVLYGTKQAATKHMNSSWHSFSIRFHERTYGVLLVAPDLMHPRTPVLPLALITLLTLHCGAMLALFEHQILLQGTASPPVYEGHMYEPLTRRQREVLALMSQGYEERAIAKRLHITRTTVESHRQNIYTRLGVHTKQDAIRVAYQAQLFSPLDPIDEEPKHREPRKPSSEKKDRPPQTP